MRSRIQRSMNCILFSTLILSFLLTTWFVYEQTLDNMKNEVRQEANYIKEAMNLTGNAYLENVKKFTGNNRITLIDLQGSVIYDSIKDNASMQNHGNRKEVKEAWKTGSGEALRLSNTLGKQTYYRTLMLDNEVVLRVAKTTDNVLTAVLCMLPYMCGIAVLMILLAWILGKWQTAKLILPVNELNLEHPLENEIYEELTPLLESMDRQNQEKEQVSQMRKEFSANVSHELKTPLTSISGYAEIMKDGLVKPEDMQEFANRIYHEASRLITLVEDIIKLSKLDEESVELEKEDVDLFILSREICSRLAPQAEKHHIRLEVTGENVIYHGIRQILDEMIYNMTENAVKYNVENGLVKIWAGNTLKGPKIIIEDTGIGIPQEHKERVFERFYRVDKSHSKETGGTGLGLSIVKHGALLHHAEIKMISEENKGTKIEVQFELGT
ncbi:MAG: ATP-binding protein [Lachnospiraceae bacterium]